MLKWQPFVAYQDDKPSGNKPPQPKPGGSKTTTTTSRVKEPLGGGATVYDTHRAGLRTEDLATSPEFGAEGIAVGVNPAFFAGDEWAPQTWPPDKIAEVQELMVQAGLLSPNYNAGAWLDESANAFKKALSYANRSGIGWEQALLDLLDTNTDPSPGRNPSGGSGRAPFAARLSNPDDLKEVFKQTAYNLLGGKGFVDEAQVDHMVSAYHQIETSAQRGAYNAAASGGTVTEAPGPDTFAEGELETLDPDGVKAGRMAGYVGVLEGLLRSGGG